MENIEVGEYVRTRGIIGKLIRIEFDKVDVDLKWYVLDVNKNQEVFVNKPYIEKHSKNIIDLIEVNDYVNGRLVVNVEKIDNMNIIEWDNGDMYSTEISNDKFIKSIVTKEQFTQMEYKVGE